MGGFRIDVFIVFQLIIGCCFSMNVAQHIEEGKRFLAQGRFSDALHSFNAAVEGEPSNYLAVFHRGTVHLALGHSRTARSDLDRVLELKPDFSAARRHRAELALKQGDFFTAEKDFETMMKMNPSFESQLMTVRDLQKEVETAKSLVESEKWTEAEIVLSRIVEHAKWDATLLRLRARCYRKLGQVKKATADLQTIAKLIPDSTDVILEAGEISFDAGAIADSLTAVRECLKLSPDHKLCKKLYRKSKKISKMIFSLEESIEKREWELCLERIRDLESLPSLETSEGVRNRLRKDACKCHMNRRNVKEALDQCNFYLEKVDAHDVDVLCDRAEVYLLEDDFDNAENDFRAALAADSSSESGRPNAGLKKLNQLRKSRSKRDYYKILGVPKTASKREITKAYRKLAQQWHPDNFLDESEKKEAEKKFVDIAAAKEVLTDEEKRRSFDSGSDPLDPEGGGEGHHHHFHEFFKDAEFFDGSGGFKFFFKH